MKVKINIEITKLDWCEVNLHILIINKKKRSISNLFNDKLLR